MSRPVRPSRHRAGAALAAVVSLILGATLLSAATPASATRVPPGPDAPPPSFTRSEAESVLAKAERLLRPDTSRIRARKPVGNGPSTDITMTLRDLALARASLTGEDRERADAILARPSDPGGDDLGDASIAWPTNAPRGANKCSTNVCVHWLSSTANRDHATDEFATTVSSVMQQVWDTEVGSFGYRQPLADVSGGNVDNPDTRLDVYLADLGRYGLYGYCAPTNESSRRSPAYCVLDNDFAKSQYGGDPTNALKATAAHEFFHAVQFGYDLAEDTWFMEGTATWIEDEVYDAINDNVQFLPYGPMRHPTTPLDTGEAPSWYGSWIFFRYASERLGRDIVRQMWDYADASQPYYSLQAIRAAVGRRIAWVPFYAVFTAWNTRQPQGYSEAFTYPPPVWAGTRVLSKKRPSTKWLSIDLRHLSAAPLKLIPGATISPRKKLRIQADLPPTARGATMLVQSRYKNGTVVNRLMPLNAKGNGRLRIFFNRKNLVYVALIPVNTSTSMIGCNRGLLYSCGGRGYYDNNQTYSLRATLS